MKWKLFTRADSVSPPITGFDECDSREAALEKARSVRAAILYIEGPNGERIEAVEIAALLKETK